VGSGNLHNIAGAIVVPVRGLHRPMRTSLSTLQGSRAQRCAQHELLAAGRAASPCSHSLLLSSNHGPLAQVVRAHG
jgi:hypothetical protein